MASPPNVLAKQNRGLLLDIVVFILNLFLMHLHLLEHDSLSGRMELADVCGAGQAIQCARVFRTTVLPMLYRVANLLPAAHVLPGGGH